MSCPVVQGGTCACSMGTYPSMLNFLPTHQMTICGMPVGSILDFAPFLNILPFGMCTSLANPTVAAATAASFGVLTPMPCTLAIMSPWIIGNPKVVLNSGPILTNDSKQTCTFGGVISIEYPGQNILICNNA